jgi:Fe-S cluster biogenesis protein NfuA/nitrite reductase/ring-hydroxylating ferredoxin subunit
VVSGADQEFQQRMQRVEGLLQEIERFPDARVRETAREVVRCLMDLHGTALARMLDLAGANGTALIDAFASDDLVASLLLLHGLHPQTLAVRVERALERARPYLRSHKGDVQLIQAGESVVRLRLEGSCHGCPWSGRTVSLLEELICETAPDVERIEVEGLGGPLGRVPLPLAGSVGEPRGTWEEVSGLSSLPEGVVQMRRLAGRDVLLCRLGEALYAYEAACPRCGSPLREACLEDTTLLCPGCGAAFDLIRAGRGRDEDGPWLGPLPLLCQDGRVRIAVPGAWRSPSLGFTPPTPTVP